MKQTNVYLTTISLNRRKESLKNRENRHAEDPVYYFLDADFL